MWMVLSLNDQISASRTDQSLQSVHCLLQERSMISMRASPRLMLYGQVKSISGSTSTSPETGLSLSCVALRLSCFRSLIMWRSGLVHQNRPEHSGSSSIADATSLSPARPEAERRHLQVHSYLPFLKMTDSSSSRTRKSSTLLDSQTSYQGLQIQVTRQGWP